MVAGRVGRADARGHKKKRRQQTAQLHGAIHCSAPAEQRSGSRAQLEQLVLFSRCTAQQYSMADRPKRRAASRPKLPSASHYVGYVDDSETPEMIAKKFEALERVQAAAAAARAGEVGGGAGGVDAEGAEGGAGAEGAGNQQQEGLTEEQLLEVFKQTSQFTVKTMMTGQDMLLFSALPPSLPRAHPGALRSPRNSLTVLWALLTRCVWRLARHRAAPSTPRRVHLCCPPPSRVRRRAAGDEYFGGGGGGDEGPDDDDWRAPACTCAGVSRRIGGVCTLLVAAPTGWQGRRGRGHRRLLRRG